MFKNWLTWLRNNRTAPRRSSARRAGRFVPVVELLETRLVSSFTTSFNSSLRQLTITDDSASDTVVLSRNSRGAILVNGAAVTGNPALNNTSLIQVFGSGGDDVLRNKLTGYTG